MSVDHRECDITGKPINVTDTQRRAVRYGHWPCCLNCDHWHNGCGLAKPPAMPPPDVVVFGCAGWMLQIPF